MGTVHSVGPNEALIVSGGCWDSQKIVVGGWAWSWMFLSDVQSLSLETMTIKPRCEDVETLQGVPLTVTAVVQCKFMSKREFLTLAAEQFLGRDVASVKEDLNQTLQGHLTAILGTITVEQVYQDRIQFAALVKEISAPDLGRMGIEILSFTISDVFDKVDYLSSLGKARTAEVKRDADVGVANAERDAGIQESECNKAALDTKYDCDSKVGDHNRNCLLRMEHFKSEVNAKRAEADLTYELEVTKLQQLIRSEEIEIEVVERRKLIDIEEKEILRKEKELVATVKLPTEAEAYMTETIAIGKKTEKVELSRAEAEKIKAVAAAQAAVIEAKGNAESLGMVLKAAAYRNYAESAILASTLDALPKVAAEVVAPLYKTKEIALIGCTRAS